MIRSAKAFAVVGALVTVSFAQTAPTPNESSASPAENKSATAYYDFAMGRLYALMAQSEGNQDEALKAIQFFKDALKADPQGGDTYDELTDLYLALNRGADAIALAQDALKQNPDNVYAHRMLGRVYFSQINKGTQGEIDERALRLAMSEFQKVTEKDPKDVDSWVTLGRLYQGTNDSANAEKAYNTALALDPDNEEALTGLALVYGNNGDTGKAIEKLKAATEKNPNPRSLMILAEAYRNQKDYKDAAEAEKKALEMQPDNERLSDALANDLYFSDQYDEALQIYSELANHNPKETKYPLRMADVYGAKKDYDKALEQIEKAKKIDPGDEDAQLAEIRLYEVQGKMDSAIASLKALLDDTAKKIYSKDEQKTRAGWFEELWRLNVQAKHYPEAVEAARQMIVLKDSGPTIEAHIIETYRTAKDLPNAEKEADAALKKFPDEPEVVQEHAFVLGDMGKIDDAAKELRGLLNGPHDRETLMALAQLYEQAKRWDDAGKAIDDAEKLASTDEQKVDIYFMRGAMLERQKKFDPAEQAFRKALALNPDSDETLNYLGYMLADRNVRLDEALKLVQKALALKPNSGAYLDSLGWVYYRQGKLEEAERTLTRAVDLTGQDPTVHDHLGDVYMKLGKTQEAIAQWNASMKGFKDQPVADLDPAEVSSVTSKLDAARVKLAQEKKR
ncbi:MAG TPA: tetratricopeptide repeat protein [Bryobacteraceae bacterium]|jgi:tetratricopeptide (TPR) repeat protein|nr:tetratricopeptide repeat protein [Bryobacteraceae bacterium]